MTSSGRVAFPPLPLPSRAAVLAACAALMRRPWGGYAVAVAAVAGSLVLRAALETVGDFYYLPMAPAVIVTASLAGRRETLLAVVLCIAANLALAPREGVVDAAVNAALFAAVAGLIAGICRSLRTWRRRSDDLSVRLAGREAMLDALLASTPVVLLDREGRIRFLTDAARDLLHADAPDPVGRPFADFVPDFDRRRAGPEAAGEPFWTRRRDARPPAPLSIQVGEMGPDHDHQLVLCLGDLTQAHVADERARDLHAQLNRVWRLNSLGEMAASLAHELNQPLAAAATYLQTSQMDLRRAGPLGESADRTIDLAKGQLLRAGQIIHRMRDLLAHETRSLAVERVGSMLSDLRGVFAMIEQNSRVAVELRVDDLDDRVQAERIQFQQAVLNLVRNAVEALAGRDDGRVLVVGRAVSDRHYEVRVEDNGAGVPAAELDTIFRPLMTTKSGGMGLGLSVTRTIVESHGGALTVGASSLGGAAFAFNLLREEEFEAA